MSSIKFQLYFCFGHMCNIWMNVTSLYFVWMGIFLTHTHTHTPGAHLWRARWWFCWRQNHSLPCLLCALLITQSSFGTECADSRTEKATGPAWSNICPCFYDRSHSSCWTFCVSWYDPTVCLCTGCLCGVGLQRSHCDMSSEDLYHLPLNIYVIVLGIGLFIFMLSVIFCCYLFRCEHSYMWIRIGACSRKRVKKH